MQLRMSNRLLGSAAVALALLTTTAVEAQRGPYGAENELRLRAGVFTPRAGADYWKDSFNDFTASSRDFQGGTVGVDYMHEIAPLLNILVGGSVYYADHDLAYRDFEDQNGHSIFHTTRIATSSFDVGLVLKLAPNHSPIIPYIGGGGTAVQYRLEEEGDFIDFGANPRRIFRDRFKSDDFAYGWFALAGVEVPLSRNFSIYAEGRYQDAHADLRDDFQGFGRLDLAGTYATFGGAWRF